MSDTAAQVAKAAVMEVPQLIRTKWAAVAVYGFKHISMKMFNLLGLCLSVPYFNTVNHGVKTIVLGDLGLEISGVKETKHPQGECWANCGVVGIDLGNIMDQSLEACQTSQPNASLFAWFSTNLLVTMLHEAYHCSQILAGEEVSSEAETDLWAHEQLFELARQVDIEPDVWTNEKFFFDTFMGEVLIDDPDVEYKAFLEKQTSMLDNRLFFHLPRTEEGEAVKCHSLRSYIGFLNKQDPGDETWLGTPIPVPPIAMQAAEINPELPATAAVETMAEQKDNIIPPAPNVIYLPAGPILPDARNEPTYNPTTDPTPADMTASSPTMQYMEDEESGYDESYDDVPFDTPVETVTVPNTGGAQMNAAGMSMPGNAFAAAGAPGTPFMMNGQQVGTNVQPDAIARGPEVCVYPPTSMDDNTLIDVIQGIYFKCYNHIFAYCGQTNFGFSDPSKVHEMGVKLEGREVEAIVKMDCLDANGRWCPGLPAGVQYNDGTIEHRLLGGLSKDKKLPLYKLYINFNGREICRVLIPQNPLKQQGNGQFSKPALAAQRGSRIMYVKEGNDAIIAAGGKTWIGKIVDGRLEG